MNRRLAIGAGIALAVFVVLPSVVPGAGEAAPPSSSYSSRAGGVGAYAELLDRFGHPVRRLRGVLTPEELNPAATVVVLDAPDLTGAEEEHLHRFVEDGGRLVTGGAGAQELLEQIFDDPPVPGSGAMFVAGPAGAAAAETAGLGSVRFAGGRSWDETGETVPLLAGADGRGLAAVAGTAGRGRIVALADPGPLQNRLLGVADNAGFAVALAGEDGRAVAFAEGPHGYGRSEGFSALPARWRFAVGGVFLATLLWLWARGRRLGPPEDEARPLPPPRRAYVDALAGTLARTRPVEAAAEPVRNRARRLVAERAGLPPDAGDDALEEAAARLGLPADEVAAIIGAAGADRVLAAGRALARLNGGQEP